MIDMQRVDSSHIEAVGFDGKNEELIVEFKGGRRYAYSGVRKDTFDNLMAADSKGTYFGKEIKNSFPFQRLS